MNPDRIWREFADTALARQVAAKSYSVFAAMPFRNQFSYRSDEVFTQIIDRAVTLANDQHPPRQFQSPPIRSDKLAPSAREITEEIIEHILQDHFFIADLTLANHGVLIEVGAALALKSSSQIILIMQGEQRELHFDIKDNGVITYDQNNSVDRLVHALVSGAQAFEARIGLHMQTIRKSLTPSAVYLLNLYGRLRVANRKSSLHWTMVKDDMNLSQNPLVRELVYHSTRQELLARGLLETDYRVADDGVNPDQVGLHATELGLVFIRKTWPNSFGGLT